MDPLAQWGAGDRILTATLAGVDPRQARDAEWRRGQAPPRVLGRVALDRVVERVAPVRTMAERTTSGAPAARAVDLAVTLPSGTLVTGTVPGVRGARVVRAEYSRLAPKHRLRSWVQVLALAASGEAPQGPTPDAWWHTATTGRASGRVPQAAWSRIDAPQRDDAARLLDDLVALRREAFHAPLPLPPDVAHAYATARRGRQSPSDALGRARKAWADGFDRADAYYVRCWGEGAGLDEFAGVPTDDDRRVAPDETTRLGALAARVWGPLLAHEQEGTA